MNLPGGITLMDGAEEVAFHRIRLGKRLRSVLVAEPFDVRFDLADHVVRRLETRFFSRRKPLHLGRLRIRRRLLLRFTDLPRRIEIAHRPRGIEPFEIFVAPEPFVRLRPLLLRNVADRKLPLERTAHRGVVLFAPLRRHVALP